MTRTLRGRCPRCCPDGGACFSVVYDFDTKEEAKKCNNCHLLLPLRKVNRTPGQPNQRQSRLIETLREAGWEVEVQMIGRNAFLTGKHAARKMWNGDNLFGTVGPRGKIKLTLQRLFGDLVIHDYWGLRELRS